MRIYLLERLLGRAAGILTAIKCFRQHVPRHASAIRPAMSPQSRTDRILGDLTLMENELRQLDDAEFLLLQTSECLLFPLRNDTWVGNPSGSSSHLPCKAEEFFLRTGKCREAGHLITSEYSPIVKSPRLGTVPTNLNFRASHTTMEAAPGGGSLHL